MSFQNKKIQNYFPLPNEIFDLGLTGDEILVYSFLMRCEDRKTFKCYPSYETIAKAIGRSKNSVRKYVSGLESKGFITTEPTKITTKDGRVRNGSLCYTILPIKEIIERFHQAQLEKAKYESAKAKFEKKMEELGKNTKIMNF